MSTNERKKIPDAPTPAQPAGTSGNLLSSVAPPSQLPNFVTSNPTPLPVTLAPQLPPQLAATLGPAPAPAAVSAPSPGVSVAPPAALVAPPAVFTPITTAPAVLQATTPEKFSPAIPPSKGEPMMSIRSPEDSQATQSPESLPDSLADVDRIGDIMPGSALFTWVKGAVSSGGLLQRVAEKAKSSVDSMITTLDPQMKEYLNSGGDINVVVASDKDVKISPVREAFQAVFGKATVTGYAAESDVTAAQPVGYAAAYAAAKQRIAHIRSAHTEVHNNVPIVAVEGFLHEAVPDRWYMLDLLVLSQPSLGIELQAQGQGCGVPPAVVAAARAATAPDYTHAQTGFSTTAASIMAASLQVSPTQWHEASTGVARRELILLAARSLAGSYKRLLAVSAAEEVCKKKFLRHEICRCIRCCAGHGCHRADHLLEPPRPVHSRRAPRHPRPPPAVPRASTQRVDAGHVHGPACGPRHHRYPRRSAVRRRSGPHPGRGEAPSTTTRRPLSRLRPRGPRAQHHTAVSHGADPIDVVAVAALDIPHLSPVAVGAAPGILV